MHHGIQLEGSGSNETIYAHIDNMNGSVQFDVQFYNETGNYMQFKTVCSLSPNSGDFYKIGIVKDATDYLDFKLYESNGTQICSYDNHDLDFTPNTYQLRANSNEPSSDQDTTAYFDTATYGYNASSSDGTNTGPEVDRTILKEQGTNDNPNDDEVTKGDGLNVVFWAKNVTKATLNYNGNVYGPKNTSADLYKYEYDPYDRYVFKFTLSETQLDSNFTLDVEDSNGNKLTTYNDSSQLTYVSSDDGTSDNSTDDNTTDDSNETEYTIELLRDVPTDQSFDYMRSMDSENITIENGSVMVENGSSEGVYVTREIKADKFGNVTIYVGNDSESFAIDFIDAESENDTVLIQGGYIPAEGNPVTYDLSDYNTSAIKLRFELGENDTVTGFEVYGDMYDGGFWGGGPITGGFFKNIPVVGDVLAGVGEFVSNVLTNVASIPGAVFEGVVEVIPFL